MDSVNQNADYARCRQLLLVTLNQLDAHPPPSTPDWIWRPCVAAHTRLTDLLHEASLVDSDEQELAPDCMDAVCTLFNLAVFRVGASTEGQAWALLSQECERLDFLFNRAWRHSADSDADSQSESSFASTNLGSDGEAPYLSDSTDSGNGSATHLSGDEDDL